MKSLRRWSFTIALLVLFLIGAGMRRAVLTAQVRAAGQTLPFTLESALQYRLVRLLADEGKLPVRDGMVSHPEGLDLRRSYSLGAEYVYAALARGWPSSLPLAERLRWITLLWFCLGIPALAWWVRIVSGSRAGGLAAGAFYAVALSSVLRSTGQELSRENFALPLLIAHLAFDAAALRGKGGRATLLSWLSALLLGAAWCTWDMVQYYLMLLAAGSWFDLARGRFEDDVSRHRHRVRQLAALVLCGGLNPYLRAHQGLVSPALLLAYGTALAPVLLARVAMPVAARRRLVAACALAPLLFGLGLAAGYHRAYGHFGSLLVAKIRFFNNKPADPTLLTFDQRIMWTPALHSTTPRMALTLFPALLGLTFAGFGVLLSQLFDRRLKPRFDGIPFLYVCSLFLFFLFFRFHVYLALFASALAGLWFGLWLRGKGWIRKTILAGALALALVVEAGQVLHDPLRWGRPDAYYAESGALIEQLRDRIAPEAVLANFGISGPIAAYGGCPVVLHPKFEDREIRDRVRSYGEALFLGNEETFRDWMEQRDVRYYVYALGEFSALAPEYQMRYFVNALDPPSAAAARVFEFRPDEARFFYYLWGNRKYRLFRAITRRDQREAGEAARQAEESLQQGDLAAAEEAAQNALRRDPHHAPGWRVLKIVDALREQGFSYETGLEENDP